ncbi:MAG TPA: prohibitin family protein [Candidatus Limnocylindrales bacterium]|jgi:regulator of protease activity HflC (stomatin/prohibitin superfamily)
MDVIGGLLFLIGFGLVILALAAIVINATRRDGRDATPALPARLFFVGGLVALILGAATSAFIQIPAGFVGVVRSFGAVTGTTLTPGLHFVMPIVNTVDVLDTRVQQIHIPDYSAASKEQQDLFLDITLNYSVRPGDAPRIVQELGLNFEETIVRPRFLDIPKSVTDDYPTAIVLNSRDEIRQRATELLKNELEPRGFIVVGINIQNFSYSDAYNQAIEDKQVAQQQVETERQKLEQQKIIAQQKVEAAKGDANSQIERARGEAEANKLVAASLTSAILQNRYIEKLSDQIQVMLVPSDGGPLILDLGNLLPQPSAAP